MLPSGFKPATQSSDRLSLDRSATEIGFFQARATVHM
jgi:hypothetical protein